MKIFGLPVPFTGEKRKALNSLPLDRGGWYPLIREPFTGAWQRNMEINVDTASSFHADFACKTLIARDIAKLRVKLVEKDKNDIWSETTSPAFSPVLRRPNDYQTRNQFWECWVLSKLSRGNTYVLKVRDDRNVVTALHVLDPTSVQPLVSDDGAVFYRLNSDNLAGIGDLVVPAREIIHDRMNCLFHPLVGTPPVFASGLASMVAINGQKASALLFENASVPGGILTLPGEVSQEEEQRFKEQWEVRFARSNLGRVAVMTGGVKYEKMTMTNTEVQMIENLKWSAEVVCSVYHVPPYKVGVGALPSYDNIQSLNVEYYSQALQAQIEEIEELLDAALGIGWGVSLGTEFDTENLLRMDSITLVTTIQQAVGAGVMSPNEGRAKFDLKPVPGGANPYLQQQNYSLEALAKRDAQDDPFAPATPPPQQQAQAAEEEPTAEEVADEDEEIDEEKAAALFALELKNAAGMIHATQ